MAYKIERLRRRIREIENQWVFKNYFGPTLKQQKAINRLIYRFSKKWNIEANELRNIILYSYESEQSKCLPKK